MILTRDMYVPALRWRKAEYLALARLSGNAKDRLVPYITIPEREFDFDTRQVKKTLHDHVHPFVTRYEKKWGGRPAWIGVHPGIADGVMDDGRDVLTYVFDGLRTLDHKIMPSIQLDAERPLKESIASIIRRDGQGVALSLRLEDLMKRDAFSRVVAMVDFLKIHEDEVDIVVDLGHPNFEPYETFSDALISVLRRLGDLNRFRNFILLSTAIPETFKDIKRGQDEILRHDWLFYEIFISRLPSGMRRPNYGDYTIVHPNFSPRDMRTIKPSGKLIYTTRNSWWVRKGGAFRGNEEQMHEHCSVLVKESGIFKGNEYSYGDDYIDRCAIKKVPPSDLTRWKNVAINHHMMHVLDDLATSGAVP
ncbi:beta family protein [Consotaella aegiceratis]|uniref:beta family protein n=1 Tax=Consotaella aegiceratis TaxID=3097961 RepID=UPI002F40C042